MKHEVAFDIAEQCINHLFVISCSQSDSTQTLSLTTSEQTRTMGARQDAYFRRDRTYSFHVTTVDTNFCI
ncbi:hypothetical protein D3C87_1134170 [compost metagenome]